MKPAVTLFAILAALTLMWAVAAVKLTTPADSPIMPANFTTDEITEFQPGALETEVIDALGRPTIVSQYEGVTTGSKGKTCRWRSRDGHIVTAHFINGTLADIGSTAPED